MNYSEYNREMYQSLIVWIGVGILLVAICCICLVYLLKNKPEKHDKIEEKLEFGIFSVLAIAVIIGTLALVIPIVTDHISDIKNQAYIRFEGEFAVVYDEQTPSRSCSIVLPDGNRFNTSTFMMDEGTYYGIIVYAEKSSQIVFCDFLE